MNKLEELKAKNPELDFYSVNDESFARYGCVLTQDYSSLIEAAKQLEYPAEGSKYMPSVESFEALPIREMIKEELFGELSVQLGNCWGYNSYLNALEWHKNSEINVAATDLVLLLAKLDDVKDGKLDSAKVKAFYVAAGEAIEVYADTLHFCPCQVSYDGFNCVVVLPEGTNTDLENKPSDKLLFRKNKWIFCHEDNEGLKAKGVVPAIYGKNYKVNY
ncbi:MAG: DUF4867 family protein [Clostridiales bacterium]|nr:DUF4867 family protein [Clostridiales bacterium]